jgi:DNA polymerase I-like protein with 3'-5' exonuclease and polymerase domains
MAVESTFFWPRAKHPGLTKDTYFVDTDVKGMVRGMLSKLKSREKKQVVGVDSETTGLDPQMKPARTRLVSICHLDTVVVFDMFKIGQTGRDRVMRFIEDPCRVKVFHNAKFDLKFFMWDLGCGDVGPLFDTQLAAQLLDLGDRYGKHDLGYCLDHYLGIKIRKDIGHQWSDHSITPGQLVYASNDAASLPELRSALLQIGKERGLLRAYKLEFEAVVPTARMELNGFKADKRKWTDVTARVKEKMLGVKDELLKLLPPMANDTLPLFPGTSHFNMDSDDELKVRLKAIGVKLPKIKVVDEEGVEDERDTLLSDKMAQIASQHPVIPLVIEYSMHATAVASYGKKFLRFVNPYDGRLHADFRQIGTVTTRYTVKQPPLHGIPKKSDHRECFVAEPGWKLVWADYSQIELRILAELSGDANMLKAFLDGLDLHTQTASLLFGVDYKLVEEIQRRRAKDLNFGIPYGVGPQRFAERAGISVDEAKKVMGDHARKYPQVDRYLKNAAGNARARGWCETMSGKIISFNLERVNGLDPKKRARALGAIERHGKNYPIQGSSADITKTALRLVHDRMDHEHAKLVNCVHDEIVLEVRDAAVDEEREKLRVAMVEAGEQFLKTVPIVVDTEVNDYWRKKKAA